MTSRREPDPAIKSMRRAVDSMRHYLTDLETGRKLYAPSPEDDESTVCPGCESEPVTDGEKCAGCRAMDEEKAEDAR